MQFPVEDIQLRTTVDRGIRITLTVPELDNPSTAELLGLRDTEQCWCLLAPARIKEEPTLPEIDKSEGKTPSQRLRSSIYILWQNHGSGEFDTFYQREMEKLITYIQNKANE
jgi:hypothetical protein